MIKHLIFVVLIAFSLQVENCLSKQNYCTKCNTEFYTLVEHHDYRYKKSDCVNNTLYDQIKNITENCIDGEPTSKICYECKRGYVTTNSGKQCTELSYCQTEENNNNNRCKTCDHPFTKNITDGKCQKKPLCNEIKENKCDECLDYYYPNKDGECKSIPLEYCKEGNETVCTKCNTKVSYLDAGKCIKFPDHCTYFSSKCDTCENGFYPNADGTACEKITINNCLQAKDADTCTVCEKKYYVNTEHKCSSIPIDNCIRSTDGKKCEKCDKDYYENKNNTCSKMPAHCTYFSSKCDTCENGFYPNADGTACEKITINNCLQAKDADTCTVCEKKYYVNTEHKCSSIPITNCIYSTDGKKCQTCEDWYEPSYNGEECIQYCLEWKEICTQCDSNYDSFDYGGSCEVLDPSKIPPAPKSDEFSSFINFNLVIAALILSLIL